MTSRARSVGVGPLPFPFSLFCCCCNLRPYSSGRHDKVDGTIKFQFAYSGYEKTLLHVRSLKLHILLSFNIKEYILSYCVFLIKNKKLQRTFKLNYGIIHPFQNNESHKIPPSQYRNAGTNPSGVSQSTSLLFTLKV